MTPRIIAALSIIGIIGLIMLFGDFSTQPTQAPSTAKTDSIKLVNSVRARVSHAQTVHHEITVTGETEAGRQVRLRAESEGRVKRLHKRPGDKITEGELILELDAKAIPARLRQARALVTQRQLEYQGAQRLQGEGLVAQAKLAEAAAQLESAKAQVSTLEQELKDTRVTAPFSGILDTRHVEVGELVRKGESLVDLVDFQPFIVSAQVNEQQAAQVDQGMPGTTELITGDRFQGAIRFISKIANPETRSFELELEIPNPDGLKVPSGMTATINLITGEITAHKVSPALFELNKEGELGLKHLSSESEVIFTPVKIVKAETGAAWVTGLPSPANIITVGHGYVSPGDRVTAEFETDSNMTTLAGSKHGGD